MSNANLPQPEDRKQLLWRYLRILWKRKWIIALCALAAGVASYYYTKQQPSIYRATAKIIISQTAPQVLPEFQEVSPLGSGFYGTEYYTTQYDIIRGRKVGERAVKLLGLHQNAAYLGIDPAQIPAEQALQGAVDHIVGQISVAPVLNSLIVLVSADDTDPERATKIANAVTQSYIAQNLTAALDTADTAEDDLGSQIAELERSLKKSEDELLAFQKENVLLSPKGEGGNSISEQRLFSLNSELDQVRHDMRALEWQKRQAKILEKTSDFLSVPIEEVLQSELIASLKQDYIKSQDELLELKSKYLEKHPSVARQEEKVAWLKENLDREIKNVLGAMEQKYQRAAEQETRIKADLEKALEDSLLEVEKKVRYRQLQRKVDDDERLFSQVQQRYREIGFTKALTGNNIELLEEARQPGAPYTPDLRRNMMLAVLVGLLGGLVLAMLFELLDSTIKSEADAEQSFGAPFLGIVPTLKPDSNESADLYAFRHPKSVISEGYRSIRTNLLFASHTKGLRTMLLTSPSPQEGKTTTAINLAAIMATSGARTLLVDTDMRRPRVHKAFGVSNERGLTTVVLGEATVDDVVVPTEVPNLFVLPCGPIPPNPSEILGGERFAAIREQLMERFERVLFDSPPVIAVTDATVLATQVDGVVLVSNANKTTKDLARQTGLRLRSVNAPVLGVVMNDVDLSSKSYSYAYYYNRYDYYGEKPEEAAPAKKSRAAKGK